MIRFLLVLLLVLLIPTSIGAYCKKGICIEDELVIVMRVVDADNQGVEYLQGMEWINLGQGEEWVEQIKNFLWWACSIKTIGVTPLANGDTCYIRVNMRSGEFR